MKDKSGDRPAHSPTIFSRSGATRSPSGSLSPKSPKVLSPVEIFMGARLGPGAESPL